ncbi:formate dehydrogenase accessory sulfurtransferase FdhD [Chengkuizengella axinellae]|uniref:Sulfur carrier protein FdhD n=1 Tax=Chengkuizengella axinellae TaxID=3064388 RepID=A0ABT9J1V7_9BACL|nr:formate dehydrogenase accessory sulfurtransferase FdhD [Chengkuizengella sp. 2205SS18-9]MDP5275599.1 formate dehydrogenase accessory sulfurtransferase FdhD [Chengkuizengella sp. 2205SS18-9]
MDNHDHFIFQKRKILKYDLQKINKQLIDFKDDDIAVEFPITLKVNGEEFATLVCTPIQIEELVIGFLAGEGLIRVIADIHDINIDMETGFANIELKNQNLRVSDFIEKRFVGSCCGKSRQFYFQNDVKTAKTINVKGTFSVSQCLNLMTLVEEESQHFKKTGGIHQGALCNHSEILQFQSDIGRHNVLDKIYGHNLINNMRPQGKCIVFSGRISSEVLLKTAKMGIGMIISKSAPTNLALDLANELGITIVGFARGDKMNVYTHQERIEI